MIVIDLNESRESKIQEKLKQFNELKIRNFEDSLDNKGEKEMDNLQKWLKIHIKN
jgi:hypothetical protein